VCCCSPKRDDKGCKHSETDGLFIAPGKRLHGSFISFLEFLPLAERKELFSMPSSEKLVIQLTARKK
jgi:hypothetical protein